MHPNTIRIKRNTTQHKTHQRNAIRTQYKHSKTQDNTIHHNFNSNTLQHSTLHHNTVHHTQIQHTTSYTSVAIHSMAMWYKTIACKAMQYNTQHNTIKYITMQYHNCPLRIQHTLQHKLNTTQHNILQPNIRQYKTIQCTHNQCKTNQINTWLCTTIQL